MTQYSKRKENQLLLVRLRPAGFLCNQLIDPDWFSSSEHEADRIYLMPDRCVDDRSRTEETRIRPPNRVVRRDLNDARISDSSINKRVRGTASLRTGYPQDGVRWVGGRAVGGLTEARLGDVIPLHGHDMLPGGGGGGRGGGRRSVAADGRGELAHGPVHHPSERLHRHVSTCSGCGSVRVVTASAHARWLQRFRSCRTRRAGAFA